MPKFELINGPQDIGHGGARFGSCETGSRGG